MQPRFRQPRPLGFLLDLLARIPPSSNLHSQVPGTTRHGAASQLDVVADPLCDHAAVARDPGGTVVLFFDPRKADRIVRRYPGVLLHQLAHVERGHLDDPRLRTTRYALELRIAQELDANEGLELPLPPGAYRVAQFAHLGLRPGQSLEQRFRLLVAARRAGRLRPGLAIRWECGCGDGTGPGPVTAHRAFHGDQPPRDAGLPPTIPPVSPRRRDPWRGTGIGRSPTRRRRRRS